MTDAAPVRLVIAVHAKEVEAGLFLARSGDPSISIVATTATTLTEASPATRFPLVDDDAEAPSGLRSLRTEMFTGLDQLADALPRRGADGR